MAAPAAAATKYLRREDDGLRLLTTNNPLLVSLSFISPTPSEERCVAEAPASHDGGLVIPPEMVPEKSGTTIRPTYVPLHLSVLTGSLLGAAGRIWTVLPRSARSGRKPGSPRIRAALLS